jgi:hypothetical protein
LILNGEDRKIVKDPVVTYCKAKPRYSPAQSVIQAILNLSKNSVEWALLLHIPVFKITIWGMVILIEVCSGLLQSLQAS